jgi:hypothetical protein
MLIITCSGYFIYKMDAVKNCDTLFLARSEQQASQNYETAVVPNKKTLRSKTLEGLGANIAVREEYVECVQ